MEGAEAKGGVRAEAAGAMGAWGPDCWEVFGAWCDAQLPALIGTNSKKGSRRRAELWFRPHAAHVLCDAQRCFSFFNSRANGPFGLLLDPVAMLVPSMLGAAEDHLVRIMETLAGLDAVRGLVLVNMRLAGEQAELVEVDHAEGVVALGVLGELVRAYWPVEKPIVLMGEAWSAVDRQLDALWNRADAGEWDNEK